MQDDLFSMQDLDVVMNAQKNNKAPSPDGFRAELVKWFDETNRLSLLKFTITLSPLSSTRIL